MILYINNAHVNYEVEYFLAYNKLRKSKEKGIEKENDNMLKLQNICNEYQVTSSMKYRVKAKVIPAQ